MIIIIILVMRYSRQQPMKQQWWFRNRFSCQSVKREISSLKYFSSLAGKQVNQTRLVLSLCGVLQSSFWLSLSLAFTGGDGSNANLSTKIGFQENSALLWVWVCCPRLGAQQQHKPSWRGRRIRVSESESSQFSLLPLLLQKPRTLLTETRSWTTEAEGKEETIEPCQWVACSLFHKWAGESLWAPPPYFIRASRRVLGKLGWAARVLR